MNTTDVFFLDSDSSPETPQVAVVPMVLSAQAPALHGPWHSSWHWPGSGAKPREWDDDYLLVTNITMENHHL